MIPREGQARLAPPCTVPRSDKADKRALLTKDSRRDKARNRSAVGVGTLNHPPTGPYSLFRVGASLLLHQDQEAPPALITGANVENAAYPVGTCAERVALGTAVHAGHARPAAFKALAVTTDIADFCSPCGMCRQFLREFLPLACPVFMFNNQGVYIVRTMEELLPLSFGPDVLPPREKLRAAGP